MSGSSLTCVVVLVAAASIAITPGAAAQTDVHREAVAYKPGKVFHWALDAMKQMGYEIQRQDSAAGVIVGERKARQDAVIGDGYDALDVRISAGTGDSTNVEVHCSSSNQFPGRPRRVPESRASSQANNDAGRLLLVLK